MKTISKSQKISLRDLQAQSEIDAVSPEIERACKEFKARRKESLRRLMDDVTALRVEIGSEVEIAVIPYKTKFVAPQTSLFRRGELVEFNSYTLEKYFENLRLYRQPPVSFDSLWIYSGLVYDVEFQLPINEEGVPDEGLLHLRKDLDDFDYYSQIKIGFPSIVDYRTILRDERK